MPPVSKNESGEDKTFDKFQSDRCFSQLYLAAYNRDFHTVRMLIKAGADVNRLEASQDTVPIYGAIISNNIYMVQEFIRAGANVNIESPDAKVTPLLMGIWTRSMEIVKLLLDNGADIHRRSARFKNSALHICAYRGATKIPKLLIERGLDVNIRNEFDETPLHLAVWADSLSVVRSLVAKGADISATCMVKEATKDEDEANEYSNVTAVCLAVKLAHTDIADFLIKAGADINVRTSSNFTPLHFAVGNGDFKAVNMLLKAGARASVNVQSDDAGHTPLSLAVEKGLVRIVQALLKVDGIGVDPMPVAESTPLMTAARSGNLEIVKLLIAKGALVNGCTSTKKTPLHIALKRPKDDVVKFLIEHGADINAVDETNETPLHVACERSASSDIIKMLFEKGASLEARTIEDATPFHFAAKPDNVETVKFLLERGADLNDVDEADWTALHYAALNGSAGVVAFLVSEGANIDAMVQNQATPLHLAVENGYCETVDVLLKNGANVNAQDMYHATPLHTAVVNGDLEVTERLLKERVTAVDLRGNSNDVTPLYHAVENEDEELLSLLLDSGADVNAASKSGVLPIHFAVKSGSVNIVKLLLARGAYYGVKSKQYSGTPVEIARKAGNAKLIVMLELVRKLFCVVTKNKTSQVQLCVQAGAILNARKASGKTALHFAVSNYNCDAVKALLAGGADISLVTNEGESPLQSAIVNGCIKIPEVLLAHAKSLGPVKYNSVVDVKTKESGATVLHTAAEINKLHIVKFLLASGAVHNTKNNSGKTPIELTTNEGIKSLLISAEKLFEAVKKGHGLDEVLRILTSNGAAVNAREADSGATLLYWAILTGQTDIAHALLSNGADYTLVTNDGTTTLHIAASEGNVDIVKALISRVKSDSAGKTSDFINAATTSGTVALHVASNLQVALCLLQAGAVYDIRNGEDKTSLELTSNDDVRKLLRTTHQVFDDTKKGVRTVMNVLNILETEEFKAVTSTRNAQGQSLVQVALANLHVQIASLLIERLK